MTDTDTHAPLSPAAQANMSALLRNYKLTPATLLSKLDPNWIPKNFLLYASLKVAQAIAKPNGRLIISWPPRHGKSQLATIGAPIWTLENFPEKRVVLATYGSDLSADFGRQVRDTFYDNPHILSQAIRKDVRGTGWFMTTKGGGMLSIGLRGAVTGKGADVFIIDDYIKNMEEALSPSKREKDWEWFTGTAYHRLEPGGSMIIIATRWHTDDLIGRILKEKPGVYPWEVINLPAIATEEDQFGRKPGDPLFPERYDIDALEDRRRTLGRTFWNAIFQQQPEDDESRLTDRHWFDGKIVSSVPPGRRLKFARVWDFSGKRGSEHDPTVGLLVAGDPDTYEMWICDVYREWRSPNEIERAVVERAELDGPATEIIIEQEPGSSGIHLINHYRNTVLRDYKVRGVPATTSKIVRAQPFLAAVENGDVYLVKGRWNKDFLNEFDQFPSKTVYDDQVDAASIGYNELFNRRPQSIAWGRQSTSTPRKPRSTRPVRSPRTPFTSDANQPLSADSKKNTAIAAGVCWGRNIRR